MDNTIYFGAPGALVPLYQPSGGVDGARLRQVASFGTGTGGMRVGKTVNGVRTYQLNYGGLDYSNFALLEAYDQGHMGPGPFVLLDPARRNLLTANQSASGAVTNDATDFLVVADSGQVVTADLQLPGNTPRSIKWLANAGAPVVAQLQLSSASAEWPGIPVVSRPYSWSFWALGGGSDAIVDFVQGLMWLNSYGVLISTTTGPTKTTSTTAQLVKQENVIPPAGAVYVVPTITMTGSTISLGTQLNFWGFQMNEGSFVDSVWTPGTGVMPVQVMSMADHWVQNVPTYRQSNTLVLQEVGV